MAMKRLYRIFDGELVSRKRIRVQRTGDPDIRISYRQDCESSNLKVASVSGTCPATAFSFAGSAGYYRDSASRMYVRARVNIALEGKALLARTGFPVDEKCELPKGCGWQAANAEKLDDPGLAE
jgi:hypothetical protein